MPGVVSSSAYESKKRILICAYAYWPSLGGLELTAEKLALWLVRQGYDVSVLTFTPLQDQLEREGASYHVIRCPSSWGVVQAFRWADVVVSKHLSIKCCWPQVFMRRPFLVWHATWYPQQGNRIARILRHKLMRRSVNVANSASIAAHLPHCDAVVHPGYAAEIYKNLTPWENREGIAFLGRLSSEKGCDILLRALAHLSDVPLHIMGDGPERGSLERLVTQLGLTDRVHFLGRLVPKDCNAVLNRAQVLAVPSRYAEPFGTVALEGLAAGCRVVVSSGGGLAEAAGPTGRVFASGDADALAAELRDALEAPVTAAERDLRDRHLAENRFERIAPKLMNLLTSPRRRT